MGNHYPFRSCGRATGVVNGEQIRFSNGNRTVLGALFCNQCFVIKPAVFAVAECNIVFDVWQFLPDAIYRVDVVRVHTNSFCSTVIYNVIKIFWQQPVVDRHQYRTNLRHSVIPLKMRVCIRRYISDPIPLLDTKLLQRC